MGEPAGTDRILTIPNLISLLRIALIPVFFALIVDHDTTQLGLVVFVVVVATDWVDGAIARATGQVSELGKILDPVIRALAQTPPELAQDLLSEGAHLVGGGSLLKGFSERLSKETGVPVHLDEAPLETVVLGAGRCLESFDRLKDMLMGRPRA